MDGAFVLIVLIGALGLIPAKIADSKGRTFWVWWIYGAAFFIVALIHSLLMSDESGLPCPHCRGRTPPGATVCRHCGNYMTRAFVGVPAQAPQRRTIEAVATPTKSEPNSKFCGACGSRAPTDQAFCGKCGTAFPAAALPLATRPTGDLAAMDKPQPPNPTTVTCNNCMKVQPSENEACNRCGANFPGWKGA